MMDHMLKVRFFKEFSLQLNSHMILEGPTKSSKVFLLMQYFLANRKSHFSKEHLMELLYEDEETDNPMNALKIIIHRLRKQLVAMGLPDEDYILNSEGKYYWNMDIPCEVDIEVFDETLKAAMDMDDVTEDQLDALLTVIDLYHGDFLGHTSMESWIIPIRVHYQEQYVKVLKKAFQLIRLQEDYPMLYYVANHASQIYPHDEVIAHEKIFALNALGKNKEAVQEYNQLVELIFNEFGVSPSEELVQLYKSITATTHKAPASVQEVKKYLDDGEEEGGAYYCNLQNFTDSYRFMVRGLERSGLSVFLMLCSIVNKQGKPIDGEDLIKNASAALKTASKKALRRGDLYTRYSPSQFLYLLVGINQENCAVVFQRVDTTFKKETKGITVSLTYKVISAADIDSLFK